MRTAGRRSLKIPLKIAHFVVKILMTLFFVDFNVPFQVITGGDKTFMEIE